MFSTTDDKPVYRETLFGSVFFKTQQTNDGGLGISMGVAEPLALLVLVIVYTWVLSMIQFTYRGLKQRREYLIQHGLGE